MQTRETYKFNRLPKSPIVLPAENMDEEADVCPPREAVEGWCPCEAGMGGAGEGGMARIGSRDQGYLQHSGD